MKLSVIICVYNTDKKYLDDCLSSIVSSTLTDYEIVFVDDGSSVDYSDLLSKYKVKYAKTDNKGHFAARLYGIELADGEYITFVDSDDTVSKNYHQPMVTAADKYGADIVINAWAFHTERAKRCCTAILSMEKNVVAENDEALPFFTSCQGMDHSYFVQWNKIYKKELVCVAIDELSKTDIFNKRLTFAEDALLSFFYFKHAKKVVSITSGFYFYRIHSGQSVAVENEQKLINQIDCMCDVLDTMLASIPHVAKTEVMKEDILKWKELMSRTHYSHARASSLKSIYPLIKKRYGTKKLRKATYGDVVVYSKSELLGDNFPKIDYDLSLLFKADSDITVSYDKSSIFTKKIVNTAKSISEYKISYKKKNADIIIPKAKNKLINKIIHNHIVYRIGIVLFPKGSKIRGFLKKRL